MFGQDYQPPTRLPKYADPSQGGTSPLGNDYGAYTPPYLSGTGAGTGPGGSTPYIGGAGDPNAVNITGTAGAGAPSGGLTNYGPYLGWDQGKLNDPTHQSSKYQFLRAMLDAGIDPSGFKEKDPSGINQIVQALNARGIQASAVPGSDDRLFWPGEGQFDAIDRTTTPGTPRFFFAQQTDASGNPYTAPAAAAQQPMTGERSPFMGGYDSPAAQYLPPQTESSYGSLGSFLSTGKPKPFTDFSRNELAYQPPYLNGQQV